MTYLVTVSRDGAWAVVVTPAEAGHQGARLDIRSLRGNGERMQICNDGCAIGPLSFRNGGIDFSQDGSRLFITTWLLASEGRRTLVLPYRSGVKLEEQWPRGLANVRDGVDNPGAVLLDNALAVSGAAGDSYVYVRQATQSNLFRLRIPK